jgi:hypothetical protein
MLHIGFELEHVWLKVNISPIPRIGLSEVVILAGVTGLVCSVPLIGALVATVAVQHRRGSCPVEQG